ncbi:hypothetical protein ABZ754_13205 [Micromonospora purpureochromogenes]
MVSAYFKHELISNQALRAKSHSMKKARMATAWNSHAHVCVMEGAGVVDPVAAAALKASDVARVRGMAGSTRSSMIVAVRYLISHPDAVAELGDLDVALYDGTQPVPEDLDDVEFYAVPYGVIDPRFCEPIARMPRLTVVQTVTAGYDHVLPYLRPGLTLANGRGVHDAATAELAVALTLAARRRLPDFVRAGGEGRWASGWSAGLADARVLIVGYGSIGARSSAGLPGSRWRSAGWHAAPAPAYGRFPNFRSCCRERMSSSWPRR